MKEFTVLAALVGHLTLASGFSLNEIGMDWSYTVIKGLAETTSDECKEAYSAEIDCDYTLVGLVASMRPPFKPGAEELGRTCTESCRQAVDDYTVNLMLKCNKEGDRAEVFGDLGRHRTEETAEISVIGELFRYTFARSCRMDDEGYCYLRQGPANSNFACDNKCEMQFYETAHNYPGAQWDFLAYNLVTQSPWWADYFKEGWRTARSCGAKENLQILEVPEPEPTKTADSEAEPTGITALNGDDESNATDSEGSDETDEGDGLEGSDGGSAPTATSPATAGAVTRAGFAALPIVLVWWVL